METGSALCGEPVTLPGRLSGPVCRLSGSSLRWDRHAVGSNMRKRGGEGEDDVWETDELVCADLCQVRKKLLLGLQRTRDLCRKHSSWCGDC